MQRLFAMDEHFVVRILCFVEVSLVLTCLCGCRHLFVTYFVIVRCFQEFHMLHHQLTSASLSSHIGAMHVTHINGPISI